MPNTCGVKPSRNPGRDRAANIRLAIVGLALIAGVYGAVRASSVFAVREVTVVGAEPWLEHRVAAYTRQSTSTGSMLTIDSDLFGKDLAESVAGVGSATVDRAFPHRLVIHVVPDPPVARVTVGGERVVVTARGRIVKPAPKGALPEIQGAVASLTAGGQSVAGVGIDGLLAVADDVRGEKGLAISIITTGDDGVSLATRQGVGLQIGDAVDVEKKLKVARAVVAASRRGGDHLRYVDVSVPDHPVSRTDLGDEATLGGGPGTEGVVIPQDAASAIRDLFRPSA